MPDDDDDPERTPRRKHIRRNTSQSLCGTLPDPVDDTVPVTQPSEEKEHPKNGSIALRAIRSVRSLARIGGWGQLKNADDEDVEQFSQKEADKKAKKEKKEKPRSRRNSRNSIEVLKNTFGSVSRRTADLSGTLRSVSSGSTAVASSSGRTLRSSRRVSGASVASTIRLDGSSGGCTEPIIGRAPKSSGASTIRWNDQVEAVKQRSSSGCEAGSMNTKGRGSKKRSSEGRRRPSLAALFSEFKFPSSGSTTQQEKTDFPSRGRDSGYTENESETSATLLNISGVTSLDSPSRRVRPRPLSEQMLGRERPKGIIGDKDTGK